jgi:hypothetical protein
MQTLKFGTRLASRNTRSCLSILLFHTCCILFFLKQMKNIHCRELFHTCYSAMSSTLRSQVMDIGQSTHDSVSILLKMWPIGERPAITAALPPDSRSRGCKFVITTPAQMSDNSSFPRLRITFNFYQISEDPNFTQGSLVPGGIFKYRK